MRIEGPAPSGFGFGFGVEVVARSLLTETARHRARGKSTREMWKSLLGHLLTETTVALAKLDDLAVRGNRCLGNRMWKSLPPQKGRARQWWKSLLGHLLTETTETRRWHLEGRVEVVARSPADRDEIGGHGYAQTNRKWKSLLGPPRPNASCCSVTC
jgi:hypothetical protein